MKDLRVFLPVLLLILIVSLLTGCSGFVPSPGTTDEDVTTISGQIKMPLTCCDTLSEQAEGISRETTCDESEFWEVTPGAIVELKSAEKGKCNKVLDTTIANDTGYYSFEDVQPGLYIITAYCPVEGDEGFLVKDVAEKISGQALDAGIPDCTSTGLALVIEKINNCYNDWYQCFNKWTAIYRTVETIAEDVGTVDITAIMDHDDFGDYCNDDIYGLVDMICEWSCCVGPGTGGGGGGGGNGGNGEEYTLTTVANPTEGGDYDEGTQVDIEATPDEGYQFTGWTVDSGDAGNVDDTDDANTDVTMNEDMTLTANFEEIPPTQYTLTL